MELTDALGQETRIGFEDVQRDVPLPEERFRFEAPEGVDAVFDHVGGPGLVAGPPHDGHRLVEDAPLGEGENQRLFRGWADRRHGTMLLWIVPHVNVFAHLAIKHN
jgi:hypothetical protein